MQAFEGRQGRVVNTLVTQVARCMLVHSSVLVLYA